MSLLVLGKGGAHFALVFHVIVLWRSYFGFLVSFNSEYVMYSRVYVFVYL